MGEATKIEWCDHTASPWYGCAHAEVDGEAHPGCLGCYAETQAKRNPSTLGIWGEDGTRVKSMSFIANLRKWNREAEKAGKPASVFPSMCDPFEDRPELALWREELFAAIDECTWIRLLLLTKRPENVRRMWPPKRPYSDEVGFPSSDAADRPGPAYYRNNVWLITSVSNQATADAMIPALLTCVGLCPVLGLSCEPLLGPVDLRLEQCWLSEDCCSLAERLGWVICGGESGHHARPMHPDWARSLRDQCQVAGVPFFFKRVQASRGKNHGVEIDGQLVVIPAGNLRIPPNGQA